MAALKAISLIGFFLAAALCTPLSDQHKLEQVPDQLVDVELKQGSCPLFWFLYNGRCYKYVAIHMTWGDAEQHCLNEGSGANLASVHSLEENNFIQTLIKIFDPAEGQTWIGLNDRYNEGRWAWSDGTRVGFTQWYAGDPDGGTSQDCVNTNFDGWKWIDDRCTATLPFVCASRI